MFSRKGCVLLPERVRPFPNPETKTPERGRFSSEKNIENAFLPHVRIMYKEGFIYLPTAIIWSIYIVY